MLSDKVYNVLKFVAQYALPAIASLYYGLSKVWNLPYSEQVVGTILAFDAFLGAILGISLTQYNKEINSGVSYSQESLPGLIEGGESKSIFTMPSSVYDILYWVVQVVLPACGALYFAMASLWGFPYGEQIVATITIIDTFLGIFLGVSTFQFNKLMEKTVNVS